MRAGGRSKPVGANDDVHAVRRRQRRTRRRHRAVRDHEDVQRLFYARLVGHDEVALVVVVVLRLKLSLVGRIGSALHGDGLVGAGASILVGNPSHGTHLRVQRGEHHREPSAQSSDVLRRAVHAHGEVFRLTDFLERWRVSKRADSNEELVRGCWRRDEEAAGGLGGTVVQSSGGRDVRGAVGGVLDLDEPRARRAEDARRPARRGAGVPRGDGGCASRACETPPSRRGAVGGHFEVDGDDARAGAGVGPRKGNVRGGSRRRELVERLLAHALRGVRRDHSLVSGHPRCPRVLRRPRRPHPDVLHRHRHAVHRNRAYPHARARVHARPSARRRRVARHRQGHRPGHRYPAT